MATKPVVRQELAEREPANLPAVQKILRIRYKNFDHYNLKKPLNELLFIICSTRTIESNYRAVYSSLRAEFPTYKRLAMASENQIARHLGPAGLSRQKAAAIRQILGALVMLYGRPTLSPLKRMNNAKAEEFLTSLPQVGIKTARCVMMYALRRKVFPVDTHCWRVAYRLGWTPWSSDPRFASKRDQDMLQGRVPPRFRFSLHVNFISLGREFCKPRRPNCHECPVSGACARRMD